MKFRYVVALILALLATPLSLMAGAAAMQLGLIDSGTAKVRLEVQD